MKFTAGFVLLWALVLMAVVTPVAAAQQEQKKVEQGKQKESVKPPAQPQTDGYTVFVPTKKVDADAVIDLPADI